jgi:NADH dehydrogenase
MANDAPLMSEVTAPPAEPVLFDPSTEFHEVVIVGGGAAGLELATQLGHVARKGKQTRVTLMESRRTHLWKPLLHAVAAGSMNPGEHEVNYLAQAHWHGFKWRFGEMSGLDRANKHVTIAPTFDEEGKRITPARKFRYDTLVIAIGSVTNDFGTPGVAKYAVPLETTDQAIRFNRRLVNACIRANGQVGPVRPGQLHVAIIGAGATGTEMAAEMYQTIREMVSFGMTRIDPKRDIHIVLIEANNRILPALPEKVSDATRKLLENLGVQVRTSARVSEVTEDGVILATGEKIPSELVVWAAGVRGPDVLRNLDGLETNRINQLVVTPTLQTTRDPDVFAMGDCACCPREGHPNPVPPRAQAAHQQATHMLKQIRRRLAGKPLEPFVYKDFGSLVSLGEYSTVGQLMGFIVGKGMFVEGYFARMMYRSLYMMHQVAIHGGRKTLIGTIGRGLTRKAGPDVKLH